MHEVLEVKLAKLLLKHEVLTYDEVKKFESWPMAFTSQVHTHQVLRGLDACASSLRSSVSFPSLQDSRSQGPYEVSQVHVQQVLACTSTWCLCA